MDIRFSMVLGSAFWFLVINISFCQNPSIENFASPPKFYTLLDEKLLSSDHSILNILKEDNLTVETENKSKTEANYYTVSSAILEKLIRQKPDFFTQEIYIKDKKHVLALEKWEILSPDFHILTSDGRIIRPDLDKIFHYRGYVIGDKRSWATLTVADGKLIYMIASDKGNYEINFIKDGKYAGYFSKDKQSVLNCHDIAEENFPQVLHHENQHTALRQGSCLEVFYECDYASYQDHGFSISAVQNWVRSLSNNVAAIYALHDVPVYLSQVFVWTSADPYASQTDIGLIRDQFVNTRQNNYTGRIAHLLSTRPLGGGIAYGIGGYCNTYPSYPGPFSFTSGLSTSITAFPSYSFNSYLIAHEIGHVMGLRHTHACVWNNINIQIDDCGNVNASNTGGTPEGATCFDVLNPVLPSGGGTIMSECQATSGIGINLNNGFGTLPGQLLYNNFIYASCITGVSCGTLAPVNDLCTHAINLPVTNSCVVNTFNNVRATATSGVPNFNCGNPGTTIKDVWFKVTIPSSGNVTIETSQSPGGLSDVLIQAYSGNCNSLVSINCDDNTGAGNHALLVLTGRSPGEIIYVRLADTGSDEEGSFNICAYDSGVPCHPDLNAMLALYNGTNGPSWITKTGWQDGAAGTNCNVCSWYGISCNALGRVTGISLSGNNLTASSLPLAITGATYLNTLRLYNNHLSGQIPSFLSNFNFLTTLDLGSNTLSGNIPSSLGTINTLKNLYLDANALTGQLPSTLPNINLSLLYVNNNNLSGCIPAGYSEFCSKAYNFSGNPSLAGGIAFATYCQNGNGGDEDSDGYCKSLGDCNDNDATIFPGNPEVCDLKDNNCNGLVDDLTSPLTNLWTAGSGNWHIPTNWSLGIVPQRCHNVVISGTTGTTVTIFNAQIGEARSISVQANTNLIVQNGGQLSINYGLNLINAGTLTNNGSLKINNILDNALFGLNNSGSITNSSTGTIVIQNSGLRSISNNSGGLLINNGMLTIDGNVQSGSSTGFYNSGSVTNTGTLKIKNISGKELIILPGASFSNQSAGVLSLE